MVADGYNEGVKITLIIPDLHLRWRQADKIIAAAGADEVVFLGDFFDDFGDDPDSVGEMANWLEVSVEKPNRIHLFGNHDVHYAFPNRNFECSGYAQWKYFIIRDTFDKNPVFDKFKFYHVLDGKWLLSHGGLHKQHVPKHIADLHEDRPAFLKAITEYLDEEAIKGLRGEGWIFRAGRSRGGFQKVGGLTWCDFEREFYPVKGLNQIVGHTPQRLGFPKWCRLKGGKVWYPPASEWSPKLSDVNDVNQSTNVCLDVWGNTHWAVWDGQKFTFFNYRDDL